MNICNEKYCRNHVQKILRGILYKENVLEDKGKWFEAK